MVRHRRVGAAEIETIIRKAEVNIKIAAEVNAMTVLDFVLDLVLFSVAAAMV